MPVGRVHATAGDRRPARTGLITGGRALPTSGRLTDLQHRDELAPAALHVAEQYANNAVEADHGWLKARLRPMRGLKRFRAASDSDGPAPVHYRISPICSGDPVRAGAPARRGAAGRTGPQN